MRTTNATYLLLSFLTLALPFTSLGRSGDRAARQAGWAVTPVPSVVEGLSGMATVPGKAGARLASFDDGYFTHPDGPVTGELRVCAIRVSFQPDTLATTWGDGSFMYTIPDSIDRENWIIDRPPHDRQYFQDHLLAARNYFSKFSDGALTLRGVLDENEGGDVYPLAAQASYQLPYPVWHINYGNDDEQRLNEKLVQLFADAWMLADNDPDVDVSQYDAFIVFHAGAGNEFDTGYDLTPFDIPSVFISGDDLAEYGGLPNGVELWEGIVPGGIILPSTQRQPGVDVGLHGTVVAQLGFALGLPHLYNTEDGQAGIGMFGLMDRGFGAFFGQIPIPPSPWSRIFMGWQSPVTVDASEVNGDTLYLPAFHLPDTFPDDPFQRIAKLFRIPINEDEYYLAEARLRDPDEDSLTVAWDRNGNEIRFNNEYEWEADEGFRVAVTFDDYDFDLPASGLLLWHIDDGVIRDNYTWKWDKVNNDPDRRGVRLVEGDGVNDIGEEYAFLQVGDGTEYGYIGDAFYQNNEYWEDTNRPLFNTEFSTNTAPASVSNGGGYTHITMTNFSAISDTMRFVLSSGWTLPGFPLAVDGSFRNVLVVNLDTSNDVGGENGDEVVNEIVALGSEGGLYAWNADGTPVGDQPLYTIPFGYEPTTEFAAVPQDDGDGAPWDIYLANSDGIARIAWDSDLAVVDVAEWEFDEPYYYSVHDIIALTGRVVALIGGLVYGERPVLVSADRDMGDRGIRPLEGTASVVNYLPEGGFLLAATVDDQTAVYVVDTIGNLYSVSSLTGTDPLTTHFSVGLEGYQSNNTGEWVEDAIIVPDPRGTIPVNANVIYARTNENRLITWSLGWLPVGRPANPDEFSTSHIAEMDIPSDFSYVGMVGMRALDTDGDGLAEPAFLVTPPDFGAATRIVAVEPNGTVSEGTPINLSRQTGGATLRSDYNLLLDSDGDGALEWMTAAIGRINNHSASNLALYDLADGRLMPGFPLDLVGDYTNDPLVTVADLTPDEPGLELVVLVREDGPDAGWVLTVYNIPSRGGVPGEALWGATNGAPWGGRYFDPLAGQDTEVSYASERGGDAYIWPNPVLDEDVARIRVFTGGNGGAYVSAKIYDLAGREQLSARGASQGQGEVELPVDVSSLPSGVYVARVEVGGTVHTIRFAVVN